MADYNTIAVPKGFKLVPEDNTSDSDIDQASGYSLEILSCDESLQTNELLKLLLKEHKERKGLFDNQTKTSAKACEQKINQLSQQFEAFNAKIDAIIRNQKVDEELKEMREKFNKVCITDNQLKEMQNTMIPIGFIYSQLPSQPEPHTLWPTFKWHDISSQYSGLFFRVLGSNSLHFGEIQEDNSPRLTSVRSKGCGTDYKHEKDILSNDQWSENVWSGGNNGTAANWYAMNFKVSSGEVRPRNQAIRIWKRVE